MATVGGVGLVPIAPGTAASLVCVIPLGFVPSSAWPWVPTVACVAATVGCVLISRTLPQKDEGGDPGWFVLDEAAGVWLAAATLPTPTWPGLAAAFALFRVFDILKPPPVRRLERVGRGWGIVLDDLMAGVYALLLLLLWSAWLTR